MADYAGEAEILDAQGESIGTVALVLQSQPETWGGTIEQRPTSETIEQLHRMHAQHVPVTIRLPNGSTCQAKIITSYHEPQITTFTLEGASPPPW
jgi:hypothetical protein